MKYTEEEMDAYFFGGPPPEDWPKQCQDMFRQVRDERDALRKQVEMWHQWERERWFKAEKIFGPRMGWTK